MEFVIRKIDHEQLKKARKAMIRFIQKYGERRITASGIRWLRQVKETHLSDDGNLILAALHERRLVGLVAIADYGRKESLIVVHPQYRRQNVAIRMVDKAFKDLGKLYGRVAIDNIPSLSMCFEAGFVAFALAKGPTGKPTLWIGKGNWRKDEISRAQSLD